MILAASAGAVRLPPGLTQALTAVGGTLEWAARPRKRRVLAENLAHALGRPPQDHAVRRLVRREVVNEARRSADFLWSVARPDEVIARTRVDGLERLSRALARGRGAILAGMHVGGWEVATPVPAAALDVRTTAIVTDDWLAWAVAGIRRRDGLGLLYTTDPLRRAIDRLANGEVLLLLGDLIPPGTRTYRVRLLDAWVELPAGTAAVARLSGAPLVPFAVLPEGPRRWRVELGDPLDPPARREGREGERRALQTLADRWSETLRRYPEHWAAVWPLHWESSS